jgi:uncharacterized protein (TIGR02271 family)
MSTLQKDQLLQQRGQDLYDSNGDKIGKIEEIYLDTDSGAPEWALVNTGLFGTKSNFVPLREASGDGGSVSVPYDKGQVKDAPQLEADGELSPREEDELYRYYGLAGGGTTGRTGTADRDTSGPTTDDAMTRSEEELRVGTTEREAGRVRLRKYVVEDEVNETVPVRREEVRVEREPVTDANRDAAMAGADITDEEHEVVLREEEVVVDKQAVPKERIRLDKDTVTDEETVSETVRKEQVDFDDEGRRS